MTLVLEFSMSLMSLRKRILQTARAFGKSNSSIFDDIYRKGGWGSKGDIYSGRGSDEANTHPYETLVADYVRANDIKTIVDVGCGDFQVSQRILERLPEDVSYIGLDVSRIAVERNRKLHANDRVHFMHCDAALDDLPSGDLVLVREVLQHLTNRDILAIIPKLVAFPHALVTNTRMLNAKRVNSDQAAGASAREVISGGLWLTEPPFNCKTEQLLAVNHYFKPAEIVTERLLA